MQRLEVSGAVRPIYGSLGVKRLRHCEAISKISRDTTTEVFRMHCVCRMLVAVHFTVGLCVPSKYQKIKMCRSVV